MVARKINGFLIIVIDRFTNKENIGKEKEIVAGSFSIKQIQ